MTIDEEIRYHKARLSQDDLTPEEIQHSSQYLVWLLNLRRIRREHYNETKESLL